MLAASPNQFIYGDLWQESSPYKSGRYRHYYQMIRPFLVPEKPLLSDPVPLFKIK
jgi:hypothetical protein